MPHKHLMRVARDLQNILIVIKGNPDPDAIASAYGLTLLLKPEVKEITIAYTGQFTRPDNIMMVKLLKIPMRKITGPEIPADTALFTVDAQPPFFAGEITRPFSGVIDHHPVTEKYASEFDDVRPGYGATSTIVLEYFLKLNQRVPEKLATALLYGIKTDTHNLTRQVSENDVDAFKYLYSRAHEHILRNIESSKVPLSALNYLALAMACKKISGNIVFIYLGTLENPDTAAYIADFFMNVVDIDWVFVSCRHRDRIVVIVRYTGIRSHAGTLVQQVFAEYGSAGGHKIMARAEIMLDRLVNEIPDISEPRLEQWILRKLAYKLPKLCRFMVAKSQ